MQAQQASAALPAAKAAAAAAAAVAAPTPALQPQRLSDAGLQVEFEEDLDEEEVVPVAVQPKQGRAKVLPRAAPAAEAVPRPKLKVRYTLHSLRGGFHVWSRTTFHGGCAKNNASHNQEGPSH